MYRLISSVVFCFSSMASTSVMASPEHPLDVMKLEMSTVPTEQIFDGTVEAENKSTVSAQTSGRVLEIHYDVDDFVEKGAVLIRLNDTAQKADQDRAVAGLDAAESRFIETRDERKRVHELYRKELIAKSRRDSANAEFNAAKAGVKSAEAEVRQANEQLRNTIVKAPYSGIVIDRHIELGEIATLGKPLMTGLSLEELRVVVNVPQRAIVGIRDAGKARIHLDDGRIIESSNLTIFPFANPATNSFKVRIRLDKSEQDIYPGMFAKVAFTVGSSERLRVPQSAVAHRSELTGVYVLDDKTQSVSLRQVRLGRYNDGQVEILAGIDAGQLVALDPIAAGIYIKEHSQKSSIGE